MIIYYTRMTSMTNMTTEIDIKILNILNIHIVTPDFFLFPVVVCLKLPFLKSFVLLLNIFHSPKIMIHIQLHFIILQRLRNGDKCVCVCGRGLHKHINQENNFEANEMVISFRSKWNEVHFILYKMRCPFRQ